MITKRVNRYYCSYCRKSGCSAGHMRKHEQRCTLNPNRECGMCRTMKREQPNLAVLIAMIPHEEPFAIGPEIREAAHDCPACILAAIRQAGVYVSLTDFNYTEECKGWWAAINKEAYEREERALRYCQ